MTQLTDLTNWLRGEIDEWKGRAERDPRSQGPSGVLAFRLAERFNELLFDTQKNWFSKGAMAALQGHGKSLQELEVEAGLSEVSSKPSRIRTVCKDES